MSPSVTTNAASDITASSATLNGYPGQVSATRYKYDANGNMTVRGSQTITWDVENRPVEITDGENTTTFVYDGNGDRIKKTENGETILYVNQYYEKNLTTGEETTYYYHGGTLVATRTGTELSYVHQDHLYRTSVMTDSSGDEVVLSYSMPLLPEKVYIEKERVLPTVQYSGRYWT